MKKCIIRGISNEKFLDAVGFIQIFLKIFEKINKYLGDNLKIGHQWKYNKGYKRNFCLINKTNEKLKK